MLFKETKLKGVFVVEPELIKDERGFFACAWSPEEFEKQGLNPRLRQCNISFNNLSGTVRGMHFQEKPYEEAKLVRCTQGAMCDVAVDLRPDSPTRYQWAAAELTASNHRMLYIPEGFAHGYQTLADDTEIFYQMSETYHPEVARGLRWDDPRLGIEWPLPMAIISERDTKFPLL
ncbi:MAG: dTDP-4-dehydrorhamnose 3,5-epimerase [Blastocatellia bacterium]|nr:dTDP-4-dehydrorhamnose 3,5-epimerase [Blastocatellia bacterium]